MVSPHKVDYREFARKIGKNLVLSPLPKRASAPVFGLAFSRCRRQQRHYYFTRAKKINQLNKRCLGEGRPAVFEGNFCERLSNCLKFDPTAQLSLGACCAFCSFCISNNAALECKKLSAALLRRFPRFLMLPFPPVPTEAIIAS